MEPQSNSSLGQYVLKEVVGRGGGAVVYKALQPALNRYVAIKVLLRGLDPQAVSRFEREVLAIAGLQHRNILPIYDFGQQGRWRYFVMQYVEGGTSLADLLAGGPLEPVAALQLVCKLLDALDYAHKQGVIHRDIKPSNVLMPTPDWPLLADFGIAKLIHAAQLTPPGMAIGTVAYMAPEAGLQRPVDARADLYATGVVLYELLTGRVPFEAPTPLALLGRHINEPPPPPRSRNAAVPPAAEAVVLRALAKDPAGRYQSAAAMQAAIGAAIKQIERVRAQAWLMGQLGPAGGAAPAARSGYTTRKLAPSEATPALHPVSPPPLPGPAPRRGRPVAALVAGLLLIAAILSLAWNLEGAVGQTPAPAAPTAHASGGEPAQPPAGEEQPTIPAPAPSAVPAGSPVAAGGAPPAPGVGEPRRAPTATPAPVAAAATILLEDTSWTGGYARSRGSNLYGGRTATWIYGAASGYATMRASFELVGQPAGIVLLRIEGMDSEGPARTPISIAVNGTPIFSGANPLPDDDFPLETGTWASATWEFDGALLRPGANEIAISNLSDGAFGGPPFFMLDYAEVSYGP